MSSNKSLGPRSQRDKPNGRASTPGRDSPVSTNMRGPLKNQGLPEFYTDSTNTSYIPSPSPVKPVGTVPGLSAKPRQITGGGKLTAAYKATNNKETERLCKGSLSTDRNHSRNKPTQPLRRQLSYQGSPSPASRVPPLGTRQQRTPSPWQGRPSLLSPVSQASPPRGLFETYQRIEDEESLAGQSDDENEVASQRPRSPKTGQSQTKRATDSPPHLQISTYQPPPLAGAESPAFLGAAASVHESAQSSGTSSSFEEMPDEGTDMLARDESRVKGAIASNIQPFSKARRKGRGKLTVENLQRQDASSRSTGSSLGSSTLSSKASDPSLNVPRDWGRKGRNGRTWLTRGDDEDGSMIGKRQKNKIRGPRDDSIQGSRPPADETENRAATAAAAPVPSVKGSIQTSHPDESIPASRIRPKSPSDRIRRTGMTRSRDTPPDPAPQREMQSLDMIALSYNRSGELKQGKSLENIRQKSGTLTEGKGQEVTLQPNGTKLPDASEKSSGPVFASHSEEAESPAEDSPSTEHRKVAPDSLPTLTSGPNPPPSASHSNTTRVETGHSAHTRNDSRDLLLRLTRSASASPDTSQPKSANQDMMRTKESRPFVLVQPPSDTLSVDVEQHEQPPKPVIHEVQQETERKPTEQGMNQTPQPSRHNIYLKTPRVIGGWIDTPVPTEKHRRSVVEGMPDPADEYDEKSLLETARIVLGTKPPNDDLAPARNIEPPSHTRLEETAPKLPKSALAAIIDRAKQSRKIEAKRDINERSESPEGDDTLLLGDSTIEDLEELLAVNEELPSSVVGFKPSVQTEPLEEPEVSGRLGEKEPSSRDGPDASYDALTSRLSHLRASIGSTKDGLSALQKSLVTAPDKHPPTAVAEEAKPKKSTPKPIPEEEACTEAGEFHDFIWPCERCGRSAQGDVGLIEWQTVQIPRIYRWRRGDWRPRMTGFGITLVALTTLAIAEWIASQTFTPPFYASTMSGFGVDYDAPRPPFVLAQLLSRSPVGDAVRKAGFGISVFMRLLTSMLGIDAGVFGHGDESSASAAQEPKWVFREALIPLGDWDTRADVGIGADEML